MQVLHCVGVGLKRALNIKVNIEVKCRVGGGLSEVGGVVKFIEGLSSSKTWFSKFSVVT